jgi:AcrR family transcriptional regulator
MNPMSDASGSSPTRERVLEAAEHVVTEVGAARLSLDGVAQAAGMSKAGLLHHFRSKRSLLLSLVKRYVDSTDLATQAVRDDLKLDDSHDLHARILSVSRTNPCINPPMAILFAAAATDPALLDVVRNRDVQHTAALEASSKEFPRTAIVSLALDGLRMRESMHISPFTRSQREQIVNTLLTMARQAQRRP